MRDYNATYFGRILNAISQLGNAISGGNPDISISARIGEKEKCNLYWTIVQSIVNFTFYPIDGKGHCWQAYLSDSKEDYKIVDSGGVFGLIIMTLLMSIVCFTAIPFTWLYQLIKTIKKQYMKLIKLFIFIILSNIVFLACSPAKKLFYHTSEIEKILKEYPELKSNIKLDSLKKSDSLKSSFKIKETIKLVVDTSKIDSLTNLLFSYKVIQDSLNNTEKNENINKEIKKFQKLKKSVIDEIIKNAYKNNTFNVKLNVKYGYKDSLINSNLNILLRFNEGTFYLESNDSLNFLFEKTDYTLTANKEKKISLFAWLRDIRSIFLLFLFVVLFILLLKKN